MLYEVRAQVMKTVSNFMKGVFRVGLKMSLEEILKGRARNDSVKEIRGWKLFFLFPRLLLFRPPRGTMGTKFSVLQGIRIPFFERCGF